MRSANRRHPRLHSHRGAEQPRSSRCTQSTRSTGSETHGGRPPSATSRSSRPGCPRNVALSVDERWYSRACRPRDTSFRDFLVTHGGNCQRSPASCLWGEYYGWRASECDRTLRRTEVFPQPPLTPPAGPSFALNALGREGTASRPSIMKVSQRLATSSRRSSPARLNSARNGR
jgi:hypothetical protein